MTPRVFPTFGAAHLAILAAVPIAALGLALLHRRSRRLAVAIPRALAAAIALDVLAWYAWALPSGAVRPPHGLPLELCDLVQGLAVYALVSRRAWALEATYFLGVAGSGMALLTPDVGAEFPSWPAAQFFVGHGLVVAAALHLALSGALRPRPGAWWRVFLAVNLYAACVAGFNARFGTNYLYLCEKPAAGTLLDLLGPWPWYVLAAEPVALGLLFALDLPFRRASLAGASGRR